MLNATQSRVWNLQLYQEGSSEPGRCGRAAREQGTRLHPVRHRGRLPAEAGCRAIGQSVRSRQVLPTRHERLRPGAGGAERADVLINFSDCEAGQSFILYNDAPSPFPEGDERDYSTGDPAPDSTHGPNTRTLMRITITNGAGGQKMTDAALLSALDTELADNQLGLLVGDETIGNSVHSTGRIHRSDQDSQRRLGPVRAPDPDRGDGHPGWCRRHGLRDVLLGRPQSRGEARQGHTRGLGHLQHDGRHAPDPFPSGERPDPRPRSVCAGGGREPVAGVFEPSGAFLAPDDNERGYKETVRMNPGEVTRVIMKFDLPPNPVVNILGRNKTVPCRRARGRAATSTCGTATSSSTKSTT